jgi:hypothetical protein
MKSSESPWNDNLLQFSRLITELDQVGVFDYDRFTDEVCVEMDMTHDDLKELISRAQTCFETCKELHLGS